MKNKVINLFDNRAEANYSELLKQFLTQFYDVFDETVLFEDIIEFAINAWNFGNMKLLIPKEDFQNTIDSIEDDDGIDFELLNEMIDYKVAKFKKYNHFILDYELTEIDDEPIVEVTTQSEEDYLSNMLDSIENEFSSSGYHENDFEENYIDRTAIIIKPKQPLLDWFFSLYPDDHYHKEEIKNANVYLIDENINDVEKWLRKKFDKFFMRILGDWHENKKEWPQRRNYKMFKLWFRVEISEVVYDLEKRPVSKM